MSGTLAIYDFLRASQVPVRVVADPSTRAPGRERADVVVCVGDSTPVHALLPASMAVNFERLLSLIGAREIRLAREDEQASSRVAPAIFVDVRLAHSHEIVFTTDAGGQAVVIRWADFARTVRPIVGDFAEPPRDRVGAYRLSYRE